MAEISGIEEDLGKKGKRGILKSTCQVGWTTGSGTEMTLILSCLTHEYAIQVFDKRLTSTQDRSVVTDSRNKAVQFHILMLFAYSGLAEIEGMNTDEWLMEVLAERRAVPFEAVVYARERLNRAFANMTYCPAVKRQAFLGVGWGDIGGNDPYSPIAVSLSNALDENREWQREAEPAFELRLFKLEEEAPYSLLTTGASVPDHVENRIRRSIMRATKRKAGPMAIVRILAEGIWRVARDNDSVGETLLGMVAPKCGAGSTTIAMSGYAPTESGRIELPVFVHIPRDWEDRDYEIPCLVSDYLVSKGGSITFGRRPPPPVRSRLPL